MPQRDRAVRGKHAAGQGQSTPLLLPEVVAPGPLPIPPSKRCQLLFHPLTEDYMGLKYIMRCVNESMRLYPHPPVLLRRAIVEDELPGKLC